MVASFELEDGAEAEAELKFSREALWLLRNAFTMQLLALWLSVGSEFKEAADEQNVVGACDATVRWMHTKGPNNANVGASGCKNQKKNRDILTNLRRAVILRDVCG